MLAAIVLTMLGSAVATAARPHTRISPVRQSAVDLLNGGLEGSPMAHTGRALEAAGWKWHVSPFMVAGIAAKESSLGVHACRSNPKNAFGLSSCGSGWYVPYFRTWAQAYDFVAHFIHTRWPDARTPWDLHRYAADTESWATSVAFHMRRLFSAQPDARYGQ